MSAFDYSLEAALYSSKSTKVRPKGLEYRRFVRAAEAIRYAMEDLPSLGGCSLEVEGDRFVGAAIRKLYESVDFPLPRRVTRTK
jgi:hypothetical protein